MFPLLTKPRGFILAVVGVPAAPPPPLMGPDKRARRSDFLEAGRGAVGDAGMDIPTTDDVGRPFADLVRF